jgi:hypothetical protein
MSIRINDKMTVTASKQDITVGNMTWKRRCILYVTVIDRDSKEPVKTNLETIGDEFLFGSLSHRFDLCVVETNVKTHIGNFLEEITKDHFNELIKLV